MIGAVLLRYSLVGWLRVRAINNFEKRLARDGATQAQFGSKATDRYLWDDISGNLWAALGVGGLCAVGPASVGRAIGGVAKPLLISISAIPIFWAVGAAIIFNLQYMWFKRRTQFQYDSAVINGMGSPLAAAVAATAPAIAAVVAAIVAAFTLGGA